MVQSPNTINQVIVLLEQNFSNEKVMFINARNSDFSNVLNICNSSFT